MVVWVIAPHWVPSLWAWLTCVPETLSWSTPKIFHPFHIKPFERSVHGNASRRRGAVGLFSQGVL